MPKPVTFPPPVPPVRREPWPSGTLVTGYSTTGIFGFPEHRGHLFMTGKTMPSEFGIGWRQEALCLVCQCAMLSDGEFMVMKATKEDILEALKRYHELMERLTKAIARIRSHG